MNKDLNRLQNFVDQMKATSSLNEKKVIIGTIKNDEFIKRALKYAYDPYKKYYVTSATCKKRSDLYELPVFADLFCVLDDLNGRYVTGHNAIGLVNGFIKEQDDRFEDLIFSIIDRNLELRASASVINKVIPGLIPTLFTSEKVTRKLGSPIAEIIISLFGS